LSFSFYLYRFRKYVSYGFPIISFSNPGVPYEMPCIMKDFIILFFADIRRIWAMEFKLMIQTRHMYVEVKTAYICQSPPVL